MTEFKYPVANIAANDKFKVQKQLFNVKGIGVEDFVNFYIFILFLSIISMVLGTMSENFKSTMKIKPMACI